MITKPNLLMSWGKRLIVGSIILLPSLVFGQTADFSFSTSTGLFCNPQQVTFTQQCSGTPDGFIWRFGNGLSGIQAEETTTYFNPGTYSVTLIAIYADVAVAVTKTVVINPKPTVSLVPEKRKTCQTGPINFTAPGSPYITSYEWDFGDGSPVVTTPSNTTSHVFNTYNTFIVTVKAITDAGCSSMARDTVTVERFSISDGGINPGGGCIPATITLNVVPDPPFGDPAVSYIWDFGDGSPLTTTATSVTTHIYNTLTPVTTASVIVATASGCTSQFDYNDFGFGIPPTNPDAVTADGRTTYCANETIRFLGSAVNANCYVWDFGDGQFDSSFSPIINYRYRSLGNKRVIMTPYYNGCPGAEKDTIYLDIIGVVANYTFRNICSAKNHYIYDNLSFGNVSSFKWTFSDVPGSPDITNYNTSHTFPANGSFTTEFILYDNITGCADTLVTNQYTAAAIFTSSRTSVCKDSIIKYKVVNPYPPESGYLYQYNLDGYIVAHSIYPELELKPDQRGIFNEFVIISGPENNTCDDTLYLPHPTKVGGPVLSFTMPSTGCFLNNSFPVTNNSYPFFADEPIINWSWDFGDNTTSNVQFPPPHSYSHTATFRMYFKITDINGCSQMDSQLVRVNPTPEIFVLPRADTICSGDSARLFAFTVNDLTWTTNYNISCLTCDTVTVKPTTSFNYIASATNIFGCANADTSKIKVYEPFALEVAPADTAFCIGGKVQYRSNVNGMVSWHPSLWLSADNIHNPLSTPDSSVIYRVIISDSAGCFADTTTAAIQVNYNPVVNAGDDQVVPFNNSFVLSPEYSPDVSGYTWSPPVNRLSCTTCPVVTGTALESASYKINVVNGFGCKASDEVKVTVACSNTNLNLPSGFTPNNDGLNDQFYPLTRGYRIINKLVVYNRWGNKVFERNNFAPNTPSLGWYGTSADKQPLDSGVFVWVVEATCDMGQRVESKGTVVLIR